MRKYREKISDDSLWLTATPSPLAMTLPFYITEAGHFHAEEDYFVERSEHDSFLLLYTVRGCGRIVTGTAQLVLEERHAAVIDCRTYHKYGSQLQPWEFFWIHFQGSAASALFQILYRDEQKTVEISDAAPFCDRLSALISGTEANDIAACAALSAGMHDLLNILIQSTIENDQKSRRCAYEQDISAAVEFIKLHYAQHIAIDDIICNLHISKYHFIRLFHRVMGVTPYSYLTAYRINVSKTLLCTTDRSISEIASECGFLDTSNFITHFKKRTGQRPAQYRRDFTPS